MWIYEFGREISIPPLVVRLLGGLFVDYLEALLSSSQISPLISVWHQLSQPVVFAQGDDEFGFADLHVPLSVI